MSLPFPEGFVWGASTAAYQIEGATNEGGRGDCVWDAFSRTPGKTVNGDTGAVACDHYHRYKEDIQIMKKLGLKHYRFSIAWPRIIPAGIGAVNEEGVAFYNDLINDLLANDIQPLATLFHWDLPLGLQTQYDGWLGGAVVQDAFVEYARVCFERFGDRVKTWLTINEPWIISLLGYGWGFLAPGRSHNGDVEPYVCGHNLLVAHAKAVDVYRKQFQATQQGKIGITLNIDWSEPAPSDDATKRAQNQEAADRALAFCAGWFADPIYFGDYPDIMKQRVGDRLPKFTDAEKALLLNSSDFLGLNSYSTRYAEPTPEFLSGAAPEGKSSFNFDSGADTSKMDPAWKRTDVGWAVVPEGFAKLLVWLTKRYKPTGGIYVTENGCAYAGSTKEESIQDDFRVDFYRSYIAAMHGAIAQGADVRGYYAWSFMDNYEWSQGYAKRFGLVWVDYETQERIPKKSALAYSDIITKNAVPSA
jgi:beta-galactosidase